MTARTVRLERLPERAEQYIAMRLDAIRAGTYYASRSTALHQVTGMVIGFFVLGLISAETHALVRAQIHALEAA